LDLAISIFSTQTAVVENDLTTMDVIAKTPPAQPQPVLTFILSDTFKFLNVMTAGAVIGVVGEDVKCFGVATDELGVTPGKGFE
jgi:hypothetical protein